MGKVHRTAQGRTLDVTKINLQNELVPAIGNMRVNARGDQLGPGGKIVKTREQMMDDYYRANGIKTQRKAASEDPEIRRSSKGARDIIPTSGGKAKRVEPVTEFKPGDIQADGEIKKTAETKPADETTDAGIDKLKGGLAKAVAKAKKTTEDKKTNKRIK